MMEFEVIPALDLLGGKCVRLYQGNFKKSEVFSDDPLEVVQSFIKSGATRIHLIDLDGAKTGEPKNLEILKKIIRKFDVPIQMGGGLRSLETLKKIFSLGVNRAILGTTALKDYNFLKKVLNRYQKKVIVGIDAIGENLAIEGWQRKTKNNLFETAKQLEKIGVPRVIYTDISKDGTLKGPNLKNLKKLTEVIKIPIIASGGISSIDDILKIFKLASSGVEGVVVGKALYTGKVNLAQAIALTKD